MGGGQQSVCICEGPSSIFKKPHHTNLSWDNWLMITLQKAIAPCFLHRCSFPRWSMLFFFFLNIFFPLLCTPSYMNTINTIPVQLLESFWTNQLWQVEQNNLIQGWFHIWAARHLHKLFTVCSLSCDRHVVRPERPEGCSKYSAPSLHLTSAKERGYTCAPVHAKTH